MHCPHCGQEHPDTSQFCPVTGGALTPPGQSVCKKCGETIRDDLQFCPFCGVAITAPPRTNFIFPALIALGAIVMVIGAYFIWENLDAGTQISSPESQFDQDALLQELGRLDEQDVSIVAYSPNGHWLGIASEDIVTISDARTLSKERTLQANDTVTSLAFSPGDQEVAAGLSNGQVQVWRVQDGELILTLDWQSDPVLQLTFSEDGQILAFTTGGSFIYLCQTEDGSVIHRINAIVPQDLCLKFSPDSSQLASCSSDTIQLWRASDGSWLTTFALPAGKLSQLDFSPDGDFVAASSSAGVYLWGVADGQLRIFGDSPGESLAFSPDGRYIICGCDGKIEIWEVSNGHLNQVHDLGRYGLPGLVFSLEDLIFVSSLKNGRVRSWALRANEISAVPQTPIAVAVLGEPTQEEPISLPPTPTRAAEQPQATATDAPTVVPPTETAVPTATDTPLPTSTAFPTQTPTPVHQPIDLKTNPIDGAEIVLVPAGEFTMGSTERVDPYFWGAEGPMHEVFLDEYWIYRYEVTNEMYQACTDAKACPRPVKNIAVNADEYYGNPQFADYPVIYVSHTHALSYCRWAGGSLPTEAEWEKAARGTDAYLFPWGNQDPTGSLVNLCDSRCARGAEREPSIDDGYPGTAPVGSFPAGASPYGAYDMGGNVWEWTRDYFEPAYYNVSPYENPLGPGSGRTRVIRGGGWNNPNSGVRTVGRTSLSPDKSLDTLGFRCVIKQP